MEAPGPEMKFDRHQWCVFYDRGTGAIVHVHEHLAIGDHKPLTQEELVEEARKAAGDRIAAERVRVLHPPEGMRPAPGVVYAVDVHDGTLFAAGDDRTRSDRR